MLKLGGSPGAKKGGKQSFKHIHLIGEKLATNGPGVTRHRETPMEKFGSRTNPADQPKGILSWVMPLLYFVNAYNSNRK